MKIKEEHFNLIQEKFFVHRVDIIKHKEFLKSDANPRPPKNLNKRLGWDIFTMLFGSQWLCDNLYPYLNDEHIDTALGKIINSLKLAD